MESPIGAEAKAIAKFFPAMKTFDPTAKSFVAEAHRKKKAAIKKPITRPVTMKVVLVKNYSSRIPKGRARKKLINNERIRAMKFTRDMSNEDVKAKILGAFKIKDYTVLACDTLSQSLMKGEQEISGEDVIGRRGCLYLCEHFKVP